MLSQTGARHFAWLAHLIVTTALQSEQLQAPQKCVFPIPRQVPPAPLYPQVRLSRPPSLSFFCQTAGSDTGDMG